MHEIKLELAWLAFAFFYLCIVCFWPKSVAYAGCEDKIFLDFSSHLQAWVLNEKLWFVDVYLLKFLLGSSQYTWTELIQLLI